MRSARWAAAEARSIVGRRLWMLRPERRGEDGVRTPVDRGPVEIAAGMSCIARARARLPMPVVPTTCERSFFSTIERSPWSERARLSSTERETPTEGPVTFYPYRQVATCCIQPQILQLLHVFLQTHFAQWALLLLLPILLYSKYRRHGISDTW